MSARKVAVKVLKKTRLNRIMAKTYYRHIHGFSSAGKEIPDSVERSMRYAADGGKILQGDYCEFGLFKGHTFLQAQLIARRLGFDDMRFFGFDSFEGLPPVVGVDDTGQDHFYEGQYACSLDRVTQNLDRHGVDWTRTSLTKGFYSETLTPDLRERLSLRKIAVALIDCDLYSSTVDVLNFIEPLLQDRCVVIMDDWNAFDSANDRGQRRALGEFQQRQPAWKFRPIFSYGDYGQTFQVSKA